MKKLNKKQGLVRRQAGMTYVELIVVLSIFSMMTSVILFNYGDFQSKVDIKNLASDIALKIVEAQKSAVSGKLPAQDTASTWKPSYGVYFDITTALMQKQFIYFVDLDNNGYQAEDTEDTILITKNNFIDKIETCVGSPSICTSIVTPTLLSITFERPNSGAIFRDSLGLITDFVDYIQVTIQSPKGMKALIKVYPSGRIQVN